jgi:hypothetical protein
MTKKKTDKIKEENNEFNDLSGIDNTIESDFDNLSKDFSSNEENDEQFVKVIDAFISEDNIEQKSRLSFKQILLAVKIDTINDFLLNKKGFNRENLVLKKFKTGMLSYMVSHNGEGRKEVIDLFSRVKEDITVQNAPSFEVKPMK